MTAWAHYMAAMTPKPRPRPVQVPASNSDARKRLAEREAPA